MTRKTKSNRNTFLIAARAALLLSLLLLRTGLAAAQNSPGPANYAFLLASGFLCDSENSGNCPAIAKSANGDSYELTGAGIFDAQAKSIKAAGSFTRKALNGHVLETGIWTAAELVSFASYGGNPNALHQPQRPGPAQFSPRPMKMIRGPMPTGGLATFRIVLLSTSGLTRTASLEVNCALGHVPDNRSVEGIRLALTSNNVQFSEEAGGRVIFLATPPDRPVSAQESPSKDVPTANETENP